MAQNPAMASDLDACRGTVRHEIISGCSRFVGSAQDMHQPDVLNALFRRGKAFLEIGSYDRALDDLSVVTSRDPKNAEAFFLSRHDL
jgi:Tfp pilus assembly protein PilF